MRGKTRVFGRRPRPVGTLALAGALVVGVACSPGVERQQGSVSVPSTGAAPTSPPDTPRPGSPPLGSAPGPVPGGAAVTSTDVVVPVLGAAPDGAGWVVATPCGNTATVTGIRALAGTVVLDPGHGGKETGAVGPLGTRESDLNLSVVAHAQRALRDAGITAVPTRTRDYRVAIKARAAIVHALAPEAVVSIHHNSVPSHLQSTPGTEVFYQATGASEAESRRLAGLVYEEVTAALTDLGPSEWAATPRPGAKHRRNSEGDDFYGILRRTQGVPTALAEIGFLSHEAEELLYAEPAVQARVGEAVAGGIIRFLRTDDPGSGYVVPPNLADDARQGGGTANCTDPPLG